MYVMYGMSTGRTAALYGEGEFVLLVRLKQTDLLTHRAPAGLSISTVEDTDSCENTLHSLSGYSTIMNTEIVTKKSNNNPGDWLR